MDQSACWFVIFFWATKMWGNVDDRQLEIRAASFLNSLKYFLENMRNFIMEKTILFAGYVRKSGAIGGVDAEFSKPMNIFLASAEERQRFEQSVDLVYVPEMECYSLAGRNPRLKFYGCQHKETSPNGVSTFTAERFEWLEEVN
jgi:hypothetical protein